MNLPQKKIDFIQGQIAGDVGIFIDYDNIYHGLRDYAHNPLDANPDKNLIEALWIIYPREKVRTIRAYADFDQVKTVLRDLQKKRVQIRQVYGNGLGEKSRKNASDIELSIDAIEMSYRNTDMSTYVFVTADSDMLPIMSRLMFKGKKVHLYFVNGNTTQYQDITSYAHVNQDILTMLAIDKERSSFSFWRDNVVRHIDEWNKLNSGKGKVYGREWLITDLENKYFMSKNLASGILDYLEDNNYVSRNKNGNNWGYALKAN